MDIIFQGQHNNEEAAETVAEVLRLFKERYHIGQFKEMHLVVTLVDEQGDEVELVDEESSEVYRVLEVYHQEQELIGRKCPKALHLVVDNTKNNSVEE